ncbi:BAG family molecular chaperone regulator 1 isoform X2 [Trichechus manatus latirostris]|uniref:BAG family molecular chaperone regulator 1 n=1 Tax=Trichechus manatus latirostris TaxID=127582 RepID=A0A2Y9QPE4_TRIMA|nr:BAG family molecular chaperone regulator 1 isoform X2 [Trichechus manatus latirostris]
MKKKIQFRVARSEEMAQREEVARTEEMAQSEEMARSEEMTRSEEVAQSEEMAATGLNVTVSHNNEKHNLYVTLQQGTSEPVVQDLAQLVEEATGVPVAFQKLIFKGKSLKEMEQPLSALGIQNGCRVMLIGKKNSLEEQVELKKLKDLEKAVEKIANQLEELNKDFAGIQQILPENFKDSRLKRKGLVTKVQAFLAECDTVEQNIGQETERLQSTNFALAD